MNKLKKKLIRKKNFNNKKSKMRKMLKSRLIYSLIMREKRRKLLTFTQRNLVKMLKYLSKLIGDM